MGKPARAVRGRRPRDEHSFSGEIQMAKNARKKPNFDQVCVWPGVKLRPGCTQEWESVMRDMGVRVQWLEEIATRPDTDELGNKVPGTGGRTDIFFAVHREDIGRMAALRQELGMRWIEDVLWGVNYRSQIYPRRVFQYRTWDPDDPSLLGNLTLRQTNENVAFAYEA
jgi:hypothetical protein